MTGHYNILTLDYGTSGDLLEQTADRLGITYLDSKLLDCLRSFSGQIADMVELQYFDPRWRVRLKKLRGQTTDRVSITVFQP